MCYLLYDGILLPYIKDELGQHATYYERYVHIKIIVHMQRNMLTRNII